MQKPTPNSCVAKQAHSEEEVAWCHICLCASATFNNEAFTLRQKCPNNLNCVNLEFMEAESCSFGHVNSKKVMGVLSKKVLKMLDLIFLLKKKLNLIFKFKITLLCKI